MKKYRAADGTVFTEEDIERWAQEAEEGFPRGVFGASSPGRPVSVGPGARPLTIRLDAERRAKLAEIAERRGITVSQLLRGLIDEL